MQRAAVDVDNVICDTLAGARAAKVRATGIDPRHIVDTFLYGSPFTHGDPAIARLLLTPHSFWTDPEIFIDCPPIPGAADALNRAAGVGRLAAYVTRRSDTLADITVEWLRVHGFPSVPLHFVGHDDEALNHELSKSAACHAAGATHLVDDSQGEAAEALANGIQPILVDHPLGRNERNLWISAHPQVPLAADVSAAIDMLLSA